ncbi:MAG: aminotransferase class IV [Bacteroidales bacterium]|nr:MAG: aminotransferase class IV [Bacteroidales bacterium]
MNECLHDIFILNNKIKKRKEFDSSYLDKGKSFYEVLRYNDGCFLFLEDHLGRIANSIRLFNIDYILDLRSITDSFLKLVLNNSVKLGNVKLVINFNDTSILKPSILVYFISHKYPDIEQYNSGIDVSLLSMERRMPNAKFVNIPVLNAVKKELIVKGFYETLLVSNEGYITEGSKSNVFFIKDDAIYTPPIQKVLPGITRKYVLDICNELNIRLIEKDISINDLTRYETIFISGTSAKILPVRKINNISYNVNNRLIKQVIESYEKIIARYTGRRKKNIIEILDPLIL